MAPPSFIPEWSSLSQVPDLVRTTAWRQLKIIVMEALGESPPFENSDGANIEAAVIPEWLVSKKKTGCLHTKKLAQYSAGWALILHGRLIGSAYTFQNQVLYEDDPICFAAMCRDLRTSSCDFTFLEQTAELVRAGSALFLGSRIEQEVGVDKQIELEAISQRYDRKSGIVVICDQNETTHLLFENGNYLGSVVGFPPRFAPPDMPPFQVVNPLANFYLEAYAISEEQNGSQSLGWDIQRIMQVCDSKLSD